MSRESRYRMKLLVTGASGMLGQDLCPLLEDEGYDVIETNHKDYDITNELAVKALFEIYNPDIVIHAAAYTNVDKAEEEPAKAELVNKNGTENIAKYASKSNALLIYISTDYVFDGKKGSPYTHEDNTNPLNVYGKTKLAGENAIKKYCEKYYIIRTSWLYGIHGKNFAEAILSQINNDKITVVKNQIGNPTWTVELSDGIIKIMEGNFPYGTYHICGKNSTSRYEFAKEILKLNDFRGELIPYDLQEHNEAVKRPQNSSLISDINTQKWEISLRDYLKLRLD